MKKEGKGWTEEQRRRQSQVKVEVSESRDESMKKA